MLISACEHISLAGDKCLDQCPAGSVVKDKVCECQGGTFLRPAFDSMLKAYQTRDQCVAECPTGQEDQNDDKKCDGLNF